MKNEQIDELQTILFDFDLQMWEITTDIALLQQSQDNMNKDFQEFKKETKNDIQEFKRETKGGFIESKRAFKEWIDELKDLIKEQSSTYATIEEHQTNKEDIKLLFKIWIFIWTPFILAIIWNIVYLTIK